MPVVRYRTRDLTRLLPGTARPGMRRMEKITGRTDDMIILRGVNVFPTQIEEIVLRTAGLSPHFPLVLTTRGRMDHLTVKVEARPDCPPERRRAGGRGGAGRRSRTPSDVSVDVRRRRPGHPGAVGGQAAAARYDERTAMSIALIEPWTPTGTADRRGARATRSTRCSTSPSRCSTSAATRPPAWTSWPPGSASPSRRSTTTCRARCDLLRLALDRALDALFAVTEETGRHHRPGHRPARARRPRVGARAHRRAALRHPAAPAARQHRGRADGAAAAPRVRPRSSPGWSAPPRRGRRPYRRRSRRHQPAAVRHRQLTHRVVPASGGLSPTDLADAVVTITFSGLRT